MSNDINDVSAAIDILIRFIRGYDKVVAEGFSLLLTPITRGDIDGGITVLKRRLCQSTDQEATDQEATDHEATDHEVTDHEATDQEATDHEVTDHEATDQEATDQEATDQEATDQEATDHEATDHEATDHEVTDHEATDQEATDHEATDQEATDHEATDHEATDQEATDQEATDQEATDHEANDHEATTNKEIEIQEILRDPESKLIFESFSVNKTSATDFIASYGANPEHFWNKLPMFKDGDIVIQLFKLLNNHSAMSDLTQRLLEIKLYEQVQLLEREFIETPDEPRRTADEPRRGRTPRSKALKRALGHKASRAEEYKVERGKKLSNFKFIDLFRISKPYWRKWRDIELEKVEMISRNLQPVEAEWAEDLSAVLSRVYQCIPSQTTREGATRIQDSELEDPMIPSPTFRTSEDPADSHTDSLGSWDNETLDREPISSPRETIISNKRPASDLCRAAKRQRLGKVTPPSQGPDLQNDRTVQPSNDDSARRGGLDVSPLRDFGAQTNPAVAHQALRCSLSDNSAALDFSPRNQQRDAFGRVSTGPSLTHDATVTQGQFQLFQAQTGSREPGLAAVVDDSISPDQLDAIIASAEHRVPWPTGMADYDVDRDLDAIIASAEPRVPWPSMASCDLDAIIASAEHRVPWPTGMTNCDADRDLDAIIPSAENRVPWSGGAYQWPLPNQYPIAAT